MKQLTSLLTHAEGFSKHVSHSIFAVAFFNTLRNKITTLKGQLSLPQNNETQEETTTELIQKNTLKDRLLSIIAHDIRSPLHSLKSLLGLLAAQKIDQKEFQQVVTDLNYQVENLYQFTENLLKWAQNNSTAIQPKFELLMFRPLVKETVALLSIMAERKGIYIYYDIPESTLIFADEEMIKLVLRNLIMNAIKFCYPNDSIRLQVKNQNERVSVSVSDTGQGIRYERIPDIFKVAHLSTKGTKNEIGVGLGLSLCKEFVEKMGGTIRVTSAIERGSCFEFTVHAPTSPPSEFQQFIDTHEKSKRESSS